MKAEIKGKIADFLIYFGSSFVVTNVRYSLQYGHFAEFDWYLPVKVIIHLFGILLIGGTSMSVANRQLKIDFNYEKMIKQVFLFAMYVAIGIFIISSWEGGYDPYYE